MDFYEITDKMDELIHDYAKFLIPGLICFATLVFYGLWYLATHTITIDEPKNSKQEAMLPK